MNVVKFTYHRIIPLCLSIFLMSCSSIMERIIPEPTATPTAVPTRTFTVSPTSSPTLPPTATFTLPPSPTPTATLIFVPTSQPFGTPTSTVVNTPSIGYIKPHPGAKFKGYIENGSIVFSINPDGDAVINLRIIVKCAGADHTVNFSRVAMKIENSKFSSYLGDDWVQGQFNSPETVKGVLTVEVTEGSKTCKFSNVLYDAVQR